MKNRLAIISFITIMHINSYAHAPRFEQNGSITMMTRGGLCGGVTLIPKVNALVRVQAQRIARNMLSAKTKPGKTLSEWVELDPSGLRVKYDWAGLRGNFYRVNCRVLNPHGVWQPVHCARVVTLDDVQHNRPCVWGPAGPSAEYAPLNMRTQTKPIAK